jgi:hypothetical protein
VRDVTTFIGSGLALGVLVLGGWRVSTMAERDLEGMRGVWLWDDVSSVRQIVGLIVVRGDLPMEDGALDPYYFVRNGDIAGKNIELLRSKRLGIGPTEEEIRRGDYTNFPWERYRGERTNIGPPFFPLLWGRLNAKGWTLVGFSDGSVKMLERDELNEWGLGLEPEEAR